MSKPEVTIVTVCRNAVDAKRRDQFLQCLQSVQDQRDVVLEHLIIDGASSDGTVELVRNFASGATVHPILILSEADSGIYDAMNKGLREASGEYVAFLNTDDFYHDPDGMRDSLDALERYGCDYSFAPGTVVNKEVFRDLNPRYGIGMVFRRPAFLHSSMLVKKSIALEMGGFDIKYRISSDYDFILRLILKGYRGCFVNTNFVSYRMWGVSGVDAERTQRETAFMMMSLYNGILGSKLTEDEAFIYYMTGTLPTKDRFLKRRFKKAVRKAFLGLPPRPERHILTKSFTLLKPESLKYMSECLLSWRKEDLKNYLLVHFSPYFDGRWYAEHCLSAKGSSLPAAAHYIQEGYRTGYDPSPIFSTRGYLEHNTDLSEKIICPLVHYLISGRYWFRDWN